MSTRPMSLDEAVDCAVIHLVKDYGFPIDNVAATLATFHGIRCFKSNILLKDYGFSLDESSVNVAGFHASLCDQVQGTDQQAKLRNTLLLLNESCKLVSNNLRDDVLLERLNEYEFRGCRASIELEEMEKELCICPLMMKDYPTLELEEVEDWFHRLLDKWKQIPLDLLIDKLKWASAKLVSASSASTPDVVSTIEHVFGKLDELGKHPVFGGILSVTRNHVAQVACTVKKEPGSWLNSFSKPPGFKTAALIKRFAGQKQAVAVVHCGFQRRLLDPLKEQKPLRSFLMVDPSGLYWEEFARYLSQMLFDNSDLSVHVTLSDSVGSTSCNGRHDNLGKLFEGVRRRPYGVVIFEKRERTNDFAVDILNQILRTGYASDEGGARTDFTKSVILIVLKGLPPDELIPCACRRIIQDKPFKTYLDATSVCSRAPRRCRWVAMLKKAREHVIGETWELVDDVAVFGLQTYSCIAHYMRTVLREMAEDFCHKRLILYPSEAALRTMMYCEDTDHVERPFKQWLEKHIKPVLENLEKNGTINESSVIFVDNFVGTKELAYMIENREDLCRGAVAKKFKNWAADMRHAYEKGKDLEQCIASLIERLHEFSGEIASLSGTCAMRFQEAMQELITINGRAVSAAVSLKSVKEALWSPVWGTGDVYRASKISKSGQDGSCHRFKSYPGCPEIMESDSEGLEIVTTVGRALLGWGHSECFLLLGLREDGKKEFINELVKNIADDGVMKIFAVDMSEYSDESSLFRLKNSPLRTFSNGNENWDLAEVVRNHPYSVFYFDEIDKAHITVYRFLLSLLRYRVMVDDKGNEVDFGRTVLIFGSDCGDKHALAILAGHENEVDPTSEAGSGQEKQESRSCQLRFELLCKVDRLVVFNPFAAHQVKCWRSYPVEDLRIRALGRIQYALDCVFSPNFREEICGKTSVKLLAELSMESKTESEVQKRSSSSLPNFLPGPYSSYLSSLPFV